MKPFYVTGGSQRELGGLSANKGWSTCEDGRLVRVAPGSAPELVMTYKTPSELLPTQPVPSLTFKSASRYGDHLLLTTEREVIEYNLALGEISQIWSLPLFNDVHHAIRDDGKIYVAVSGIDSVVAMGSSGVEVLPVDEQQWAVDPEIDYRLVSTKPHRIHPNHLFTLNGQIWVTRCNFGDAVPLGLDMPALKIASKAIHDGFVQDGLLWFTSVDGFVHVFDAKTMERCRTLNIHDLVKSNSPLGWCRGLMIDGDIAYVGFSILRETRLRSNLRWITRQGYEGRGVGQTQVVVVDMSQNKILERIDLKSVGMDTVFSVIDATKTTSHLGE